MNSGSHSLSLLRTGSSALSTLFQGVSEALMSKVPTRASPAAVSHCRQHRAPLSRAWRAVRLQVVAAFPTLKALIQHDDDEVVSQACWALAHLSDDDIQVCGGGACACAWAGGQQCSCWWLLVVVAAHGNCFATSHGATHTRSKRSVRDRLS